MRPLQPIFKSWLLNARGKYLDYAATFGTEFAVMASQILAFKMAAHFLGAEGFSEYALARRTIAFICPVLLGGMGVALPRFVAYANGRGDQDESERFFAATVHFVAVACLLLGAALTIFPSALAYLFFGQRHYAYLIPTVGLVASSLAVHAVVYGYFRGRLAFRYANALQVVNLGLIPIFVFYFSSDTVEPILRRLGGFILVVSLGAILLFAPWRRLGCRVSAEVRQLLHYSIPRIPGDFALLGILTLPTITAVHLRSVREAGMVAFGISMVNQVCGMVSPVGLILLPKVSKSIGEGRLSDMYQEIIFIAKVSVAVPIALILIVELAGRWLLGIYLGPQFQSGVTIIQLLILGSLPLSFYNAMRSVMDAFHQTAVNARNLVISLGAFLLLLISGHAFHRDSSDLWAFVGATSVLGLLTLRELLRILPAKVPGDMGNVSAEVRSDQPV